MNIEEANEIIDAYLFWGDKGCNCPSEHPPCSKCEECPLEEDYNEARNYLDECDKRIVEISKKMIVEEIETSLIQRLVEEALIYDGIFELAEMWFEETDEIEKQEILKDIKEMLEDTLTQCPSCLCMTKTVNGKCGKCGRKK